MPRRPLKAEPMVLVIRDPRNAKLDYKITLARAKELYAEGKLSYDITNGTYCTKQPNDKEVK